MSIDFQDRIDAYLLGRMTDEEKKRFEAEVSQDEEKREQLDLTRSVKTAISSRESKLSAMAEMMERYNNEHQEESSDADESDDVDIKPRRKRTWMWISGIAAALILGVFIVTPYMRDEVTPPAEVQRGDDEMFTPGDSVAPVDTCQTDTLAKDSIVKAKDSHE